MNGSNAQEMQVQEARIVPVNNTMGLHEEIDIQIATAHRYPRDIEQFRREALSIAIADEDTAASCFYKLPRKKKDEATGEWIQTYIEGPGVRLAEIFGMPPVSCVKRTAVSLLKGWRMTSNGMLP
jgi:hypothetical protein